MFQFRIIYSGFRTPFLVFISGTKITSLILLTGEFNSHYKWVINVAFSSSSGLIHNYFILFYFFKSWFWFHNYSWSTFSRRMRFKNMRYSLDVRCKKSTSLSYVNNEGIQISCVSAWQCYKITNTHEKDFLLT